MGVFSGLEGNLEKYIEGFFKDKFKSRVQPAEIAKKLAREMRDRRRTGVNKMYAPNTFTVYLSTADYDRMVSLAAALAKELADYVSQKAQEKRYTLTGTPQVEFARAEGEETGFLHIVSGYSADQPASEPDPLEERVLEQTQKFRLTKEMITVAQGTLLNHWLEVAVGPEKGRLISLAKPLQVLGRHSGCDILLLDGSVSRRQAKLERRGNQVVIEDLGSTNGTWVNGSRVDTRVLAPGDEVALGATVCIYKVD